MVIDTMTGTAFEKMMLKVERTCVTKKVHQPHGGDALFVTLDGYIISQNDDFLERVVYLDERSLLLLPLLVVVNMIGRLNVVSPATQIAHEVYFKLCLSTRAIGIGIGDGHDSHVDIEAPNTQFIVHHVLHDMGTLFLTEVKPGIAQPEVGKIIFAWGVDIMTAFHVVAYGTLNKERIAQVVE